jgi:hypothetical protein
MGELKRVRGKRGAEDESVDRLVARDGKGSNGVIKE